MKPITQQHADQFEREILPRALDVEFGFKPQRQSYFSFKDDAQKDAMINWCKDLGINYAAQRGNNAWSIIIYDTRLLGDLVFDFGVPKITEAYIRQWLAFLTPKMRAENGVLLIDCGGLGPSLSLHDALDKAAERGLLPNNIVESHYHQLEIRDATLLRKLDSWNVRAAKTALEQQGLIAPQKPDALVREPDYMGITRQVSGVSSNALESGR